MPIRRNILEVSIPLTLALGACVDTDTRHDLIAAPGADFTVFLQRADMPTQPFAYASLEGDSHDVRDVGFGFSDGAAVSADGKRLAFPSFHLDPGAPHLTLAALDGSAADDVVIEGDGSMAIAPSWSPDDARVAFARAVFDGQMVGRTGIYAVDAAAGASEVRLDLLALGDVTRTPASLACVAPVWSPDGRRLAYGTNTGVSVYSFDDHAVHELVSTGSAGSTCGPRWSPDGASIAYAADGQLLRIASDGQSAPTVLASLDGDAAATRLRWSPNGRTIAYTDGGALRVIAATGGAPTTLDTTDGSFGPPEWSPDGRTLLYSYSDGGPSRLAVIAADGGGDRRTLAMTPGSYYAALPVSLR
jgi:Tol biopolymer transport system component